jgi:topoisomerase-4 subunit B
VVEPLKTRRASAATARSARRCVPGPIPSISRAPSSEGELTHLLRSKAVLMPGVTVSLKTEKSGESLSWIYKGGLRDYLMQTLTADPVIPLFEGEHYADRGETENFAEGEGAAWCVAFTEEGAPCARATST